MLPSKQTDDDRGNTITTGTDATINNPHGAYPLKLNEACLRLQPAVSSGIEVK
jgi:hypothetical protein